VNDLTPALLQDVVSRVLEDCAFMCTEPSPESTRWSAPITRATLEFSGPRSGTIEVYATRELTMAIAADMLGIEMSDPDATELADGALGEITNVIAGALVARMFGTDCLVELGIPVVDFRIPEPRRGEGCGLRLTDMEGRAIDVRVSLGAAA
jgi:CheY-specific phosphatase CheX